jgi:MFS family permease
MRQPPILLLLVLNIMVAFASYLSLKLGIGAWTAARWSAFEIGLAVTAVGLSYATLVSLGGRLADRYGRARVSSLGACLGTLGCALPLLSGNSLVEAAAAMLAFAGCAFFFPGIAGLFSDSEAVQGKLAHAPLHYRISQYNIGWSAGNVIGFITAFLIAPLPLPIGYGICTLFFLIPSFLLFRYYRLPPANVASSGDRSDHPNLERLTLNGRIGLLIACLVGFSLLSQLDKALSEHLTTEIASRRASFVLASYSAGYCSMFVFLGHWSGWIMRPKRLLLLQLGLMIGPLGFVACGITQHFEVPWLTACGLITGWGYGAAYKGSIYYSLRLPHGTSRAAGLHETFLGVGISAGPVLCGIFMYALRGYSHLAALGCIAASFAVVNLIYQVVMMPKDPVVKVA